MDIKTFYSVAKVVHNVSLFCATMYNIDEIWAKSPPALFIALLNRIFVTFDHLCIKNKVSKIESTSAYVAAGGLCLR